MSRIFKHVAFIMDGNGRWAKRRLLPRNVGHREGVKAMQRVIDACAVFGVEAVSFYAFSTENWSRPQDEVEGLFKLVVVFAEKELPKYADKNFRVQFMGDLTKLPEDARVAIAKVDGLCKNNTGMFVNIGLNYGGQDEIVRAVKKLNDQGVDISLKSIEKALDTSKLPSLDLIVRSAGEQRLSNFMLWQAAYSELVFRKELWPEFDKSIIEEILNEYNGRTRKFGKLEE